MNILEPSLELLFEQLGLPSSSEQISEFVASHQLAEDMSLLKAPFWNAGQKQFLTEKLFGDDEWAPVVDQLNTELHSDTMLKT
jgi:hypothetical protein